MRAVALIARRELAAYLRTPSGYLICAVALLVNALQFNAVAIGDGRRLSQDVLRIFLFNAAFIVEAAAVLLSMRLLAEDRASGAQTLLFTSPVREREIVLGKYLSAFALLSLITLLSLYLPALIFVNGKVSLGHIASGYLGLLLVGAATLSIGMFVSSLSPHPFIAVLGAAAIVGTLELCWYLGRITEGSMAQFIASLAPVWNHFTSFREGVLSTADVVYYLSIVYLMLLGSTRVLTAQRWR